MLSEKTIYWLAVAVLTFGVTHSAVNRHAACVGAFSGNLSRQVGERGMSGFDRAQMADARVQTRLACVQVQRARRQQEIARLQADRARMMAEQRMSQMTIMAPSRNVTVDVPEPPAVPDNSMY